MKESRDNLKICTGGISLKKKGTRTGIVAILRHSIWSVYFYLLKKSELLEIPIEACTNMLAFSFSNTGWNYLIETLKEYDAEKTTNFMRTTLYKFHKLYHYEDTFGLFCCDDNDVKFRPPFGIYPWGSFKAESQYNGGIEKNRFTSRFCGPSDDSFIEKEHKNIIGIYNDIKKNGYSPWRFGKSFIGVTVLERTNGEKKFVILQGNHRTAAMSNLGFKTILARYQPSSFKIIREREISDWFYVKKGECSKEDAQYYFNLFFSFDGNERALALGLKNKKNVVSS